MKIIQFISRRYLFSKKYISLISVLTAISITGITIGTALLIVILSVFNGFYDVIRGYLLTFDPDIRIERADHTPMLADHDATALLADHPDVVTVMPYVSGQAMLVFENGRNEVLNIRGVDSERDPVITDLLQGGEGTEFEFSLAVEESRPGALVSETLINRYRLNEGDEIAMLSPTGMRRALTQFSSPRSSRFTIRAGYDMHQIVDLDVVYVDIEAAQRLFNLRNQITGFDITLTDTDKAEEVKKELMALIGDQYTLSTWYDLQKPLYDVMYLEKWGSYFILMIIVLVAVLNILGSLTMIVLQKKRDIGVLMSLGMNRSQIRKIFRAQGIWIGLIGTGIGGLVGLGLTIAQKQFSLVKLSSSFIIEAYPVSIQFSDILMVITGTMVLCLLASWYPAIRASGIEPADAVREE